MDNTLGTLKACTHLALSSNAIDRITGLKGMDAIKTLCVNSTAASNSFHGVTLFAGRLQGIKSRCAVCVCVILASLLQITALAGISGSGGHS
jgi:hypothetical protein